LASLAEKYRQQGLEVVGLSIEDPATDRDKVQRFKERFRMGYHVGFTSMDMFESYIGPGQQPIPQSLVFDRHGRLQAHIVGFNPRRDPPRLESLITRLL
jgi:glutathione peroxidase-family protein